jgi:hypothetical protein
VKDPSHLEDCTMPNLPQQRDRLQPAETLFNTFPFSLTDGISGVVRRASINRTPTGRSRFWATCGVTFRFSRTNTSLWMGLLEVWASVKSYQRKDAKNAVPPDDPGNATVDFHGEKRSNQTHASKTDPDAKMARKGKDKEAKLSYNGNLLVENRHGLIVNTEVFEANGTAKRDAALVILEQIPGTKQVTVGGDKAYDTADCVAECRTDSAPAPAAARLGRRLRQCTHRAGAHGFS